MATSTARGSRSPPATRSAPARSARDRHSAAPRSSADRYTFRDDRARPSGSRTMGHPTTSTWNDRSRAIRWIRASCCASFSPRYAAAGPTAWNSLATTVATPRKWPGRMAPSSRPARGPGSTVTSGSPSGYISRPSGANTRSTPSARAIERSRSRSRGYASKSSPGPNCKGFTKIDTATTSRSARARRISEMWPSWNSPMVGTNPTVRPAARSASQASRNSAIRTTTFTASTPWRDRSRRRPPVEDLLHRRPAGPVQTSGPGGQLDGGPAQDDVCGDGPRRPFGQRPEVPLDRGGIAPGHRAGEGGRRPPRRGVLQAGPGQREERLDGVLDPGRGEDLLRQGHERDQVVRGQHGAGVVQSPVLLGDPERAPAEVGGDALAERGALVVPGRDGDRAPGHPLQRRLDGGEGLERMQGQHPRPRLLDRSERLQPLRPGQVSHPCAGPQGPCGREGPRHLLDGPVGHADEHEVRVARRVRRVGHRNAGQEPRRPLPRAFAAGDRHDAVPRPPQDHAERGAHPPCADHGHVHGAEYPRRAVPPRGRSGRGEERGPERPDPAQGPGRRAERGYAAASRERRIGGQLEQG